MITASTDVSEAANEASASHFNATLLPAGGAKELICLFQLLQTLQSLFNSVSFAFAFAFHFLSHRQTL